MELTKEQRRFMLDEDIARYVREQAKKHDIPYTIMLRWIIKEYKANHEG